MTHQCDKVGLEFFESAPTIHRATVEIDASPDDVFEVLLDGDAWTQWAFPITGVDWTSGFPLEVGSTRTVHMRGDLVGYEEFIAYEHGRRMAFRFNEASSDRLKAFAEDYQVTDLGNGRTRIAWTMAMDSGGGSGLRAKVMDPIMSIAVRRMLKKLGRFVESSRTTESAA